MKRKLPRITKIDGTKYKTGDSNEWTYKYTWEDLANIEAMPVCMSECMPTFDQIYKYGILHEMLNDLKSEFGIQNGYYIKRLDDEWDSIVKKFNNKNE